MKKFLSLALAVALLLSLGAVMAGALNENGYNRAVENLETQCADYIASIFGDKTVQESQREKFQSKRDELRARQAPYFARAEEIVSAGGDICWDSAHNELQKAYALAFEFYQREFTRQAPSAAVRAVGGNPTTFLLKFLWSLILRYVFFGWIWMFKLV